MPAAEPTAVEKPSTSFSVTTPSSPTFTNTPPSNHNVSSSPADDSENSKGEDGFPRVVEVGQYDAEAQQGDPDQDQSYHLPPVDTGKDAWLFLAACFVMEAMVWGESSLPGACQSSEYGVLMA